jgi:hypothetical protein
MQEIINEMQSKSACLEWDNFFDSLDPITINANDVDHNNADDNEGLVLDTNIDTSSSGNKKKRSYSTDVASIHRVDIAIKKNSYALINKANHFYELLCRRTDDINDRCKVRTISSSHVSEDIMNLRIPSSEEVAAAKRTMVRYYANVFLVIFAQH